jgi:hypothetical protein
MAMQQGSQHLKPAHSHVGHSMGRVCLRHGWWGGAVAAAAALAAPGSPATAWGLCVGIFAAALTAHVP